MPFTLEIWSFLGGLVSGCLGGALITFMTQFNPCLMLSRLVVKRSVHIAYDERFHTRWGFYIGAVIQQVI